MKKTAIALAISGLAFASVTQAAPQPNTFYVGAKAGWAQYHRGVKLNASEKLQGYSVKRDSLTYGALLGYQITPYFALETGYDRFGHYKKEMSNGKTEMDHTAHGVSLKLKASYPITENLDVYAKAGSAWVFSKYKNYARDTQKSKRFSPLFAGGLEYALTKNLAVNLEYQWLDHVGKVKRNHVVYNYHPDIGSLTAGISYRFGQVERAEIITKKFALSSDVLFGFGKAGLKPAAAQTLDGIIAEVNSAGLGNPVYNISGYSDRLGSDVVNLKISQKRAETVANYLVTKGVSTNNISAVGYGEANPVTGTSCDAVKGRKALITCLAPDRRVEISVQGAKTFKK